MWVNKSGGISRIAKRTAAVGVAGGVGALSLEALSEAGVQQATHIQNIIGNVAQNTVNVLSQSHVQIWDLAPISDFWISQFAQNIGNGSLWWTDMWVSALGWLVGNYIWKKWSQITGKILWVSSESDDTVSGISIGGASSLALVWLSGPAMILAGWGVGYVIGRKLWEKILGEKNAKMLGVVGWIAGAGTMIGLSSSILIPLSLAGATAWFIWNINKKSAWSSTKHEKKEDSHDSHKAHH